MIFFQVAALQQNKAGLVADKYRYGAVAQATLMGSQFVYRAGRFAIFIDQHDQIIEPVDRPIWRRTTGGPPANPLLHQNKLPALPGVTPAAPIRRMPGPNLATAAVSDPTLPRQ
jgi:hypothetical protein